VLDLGSARRTRRANKALVAITDAAGGDPRAAEEAVGLLEAVATMLGDSPVTATLPATEQAAWEALGATFDAPETVRRAALRARAAVAALRAGAADGDAAVADRLGVNRSRISQRVAERSLYAVTDDDGRWFPAWQFDGTRTITGLRTVLTVLDPQLHPLTVTHFFLTASAELELDGQPTSPRDWLITGGDPAAVAVLASGL
jgi:hypothetical protein